jgi:cytochrome c-type biogenesis protein CcmH
MTLWLTLGAMTTLAIAMILAPLLRHPKAAAARREFELEVYRAQLRELSRELERGMLGPEEAAAARLELERRILAADADPAKRRLPRPAMGHRRLVVLGLLIGFPLITGALYWQLGSPEVPGQPFAQRSADGGASLAEGPAGAALASVETLVARLRERVTANPADLEGWYRLGRAYALTEQFEAAADAYRQAIALRPDLPELHAALGEALVLAQDGIVTEPARDAFARAIELDPGDPRARFYQGLALVQRGEPAAGLEAWLALIRDAPADAPWLPDLRTRVAGLATELGRDPAALLPAAPAPPTVAAPGGAPRGPSAEQMGAAQAMAPEAQADMIRGMVDGLAARLEAQPDDVEGWRMLARSYGVLGEPERSAEAYQRVARLLPADVDAQLDYAEALLAARGADQPLSVQLVAQMRRVHELDPDHPDALFYLGRAAAEGGDPGAASRYWQALLAQLPAGSAERAQLQRLIDQLPAED